MVIISVEVPDIIAKRVRNKKVISLNTLYEYDEDTSYWNSVKVWEKTEIVLDFLKSIK